MLAETLQTPSKTLIYRNIHTHRAGLILSVILLAGIIFRVYISFFTGLPHVHQDTPDYLKQAEAIISGGYINYFPNGYPLLIAGIKMASGPFLLDALVWTNILMATATLYFVYAISRNIFQDEFLALSTVFLLAVLPTQINMVRWITSEVPTTFFLAGSYLLYYRKKWAWSGFFMGITILIRTEMLMIFVLVALFELVLQKRLNLKYLISCCLVLLMMAMYCYNKTGEFSISGHGKVNIAYAITASGSDIDWNYLDNHPEIKTKDDAVRMYVDHIKSEPIQFSRERLANLGELWGFPSSTGGTRSMASRLLMGFSNLFLVIFGCLAWWKNRHNFKSSLLIIPFVVITAVHVLLLATTRYTFPVEPFLSILAVWMLLYFVLPKQKVNNI